MKPRLPVITLLLIAVVILSVGEVMAAGAVPGDRNVPLNIIYPAKAQHENGGELYDITKAPFNAKGDGVTDNTAAFVAMMDAVRDATEAMRSKKSAWGSGPGWFYVPNGTYLVSDSIVCSREVKDGFAGLKLIGQDRRKTIIKLQDNSDGFSAGATKPLISWSKDPEHHQCGIAWGNEIRNLTLNTGKGNPGAVGLLFLGANACSMDNLNIVSGDGQGHCGLYFPTWAIQGYFHDITITGFDYGIETLNKAETNPTLEYLTLRGQGKAGVHVGAGCPGFRMLLSENTVPAVQITGADSQVVIIDSKLTKGAASEVALKVENAQGQIFVRNVETAGYGKAIEVAKSSSGQTSVAGGKIDEWLNGPVISFGNSPQRTLHLPIEEVPPSIWESDPAKWAVPEDFEGDDQARVQAALDSGKASVLLPSFGYTYKDPIRIPATVNHLDLMQHNTRAGTLEITEASNVPLLIEHPGTRVTLNIREPRTVVIRYGDAAWTISTDKPVTVHALALANTGPHKRFCPPNARIYARSINNENKGTPEFPVDGGLMWVLGFKAESPTECFAVRNGGILEVLGGYRNQCGIDGGKPMILNEDSNVSFVGFSNMARIFNEAIWETRGGDTRKLGKDQMPKRPAYNGTYFVPLYVGYDPSKVAEMLKTKR